MAGRGKVACRAPAGPEDRTAMKGLPATGLGPPVPSGALSGARGPSSSGI